MLDREKIIEGLEECTGNGKCTECQYREEKSTLSCKKLLADALELLKEQEAKKVESIRFSRYCPLCHRLLREQFNKYFCGNCGQAVKWNDSERV